MGNDAEPNAARDRSLNNVPEGIDPFDERAARRAAIECINAAGLMLTGAIQPPRARRRANILVNLYELDRALVNARLYHATIGTLRYFGTPCHKAYQITERIRTEISLAVTSYRVSFDAPADGWSSLWDHYHNQFGGTDGLWNSYRCGSAPTKDDAVRFIQSDIRRVALASPWHFRAWPAVCDRLKRFSQQELSDLMRALRDTERPADPARPSVTPKRSTAPGDAQEKMIAALSEHHQFDGDSCGNFEPIGVNELQRKAAVGSNSTASEFFKSKFGGHAAYKAMCRDKTKLIVSLKVLRGELSPEKLFGRSPPGEAERRGK